MFPKIYIVGNNKKNVNCKKKFKYSNNNLLLQIKYTKIIYTWQFKIFF